jgi:hypothetical protein
MVWLLFFVVVALVGALGIVVNVSRLRFERRVADEIRALLAVPPSVVPRPGFAKLPPPVARYRQISVGDHAPVRTLRMRHGGSFCTSPTAKAVPIRGTQLFTADPPGFHWIGRIRMAPGVWIDARDMSVAGEGSMRVLFDDTVPLVDARGPEIDQGSALRLLAEMAWYPTSLFDARSVTWSAIDADHARATLRLGGREVSGVFEFGPDGLPLRMTAERFTDKGELRPWGGVYRDWRVVSGMRVPFEAEVTWQLESGPYTYAHWLVDSMEYDLPTKGQPTAVPRIERLPTVVPSPALKAIKAAHTMVWALFAGCILAIPLVSWRGGHRAAASLAAIVAVEVVVLALNHGRCPLTAVAARYTDDRRANFDVHLPEWLAKHNKLVFGTLYFAGVAFALARWVRT